MIRDRIKELRRVKGSELVPNPKNWRTHSKKQRRAMSAILRDVGFAGAALARETPEGIQLIDGHLRAEIMPEDEIPVLITDLDDAETLEVMATYDPIGAMAEVNKQNLDELLRGINTGEEAIQELMAELAEKLQYFDAADSELPDLPSGEKSSFQQMTFTLHDEQVDVVKRAMDLAISSGCESALNENKNGNAIAAICEAYMNE